MQKINKITLDEIAKRLSITRITLNRMKKAKHKNHQLYLKVISYVNSKHFNINLYGDGFMIEVLKGAK